MSLHDNLFSEDAEEDVRHFLSSSEQRKRVLIFPPVNNYRRFLIHQLVQDRYGDLLHTFSIGQGFDRRTVVCYKSDFVGLPAQVNGVAVQGGNSIIRKSLGTMGIESQCTPTASPEHNAQRPRQIKSSPSVEIYVPPALRRSKLEKSPSRPGSVEPTPTTEAPTKANRQKRPDRAVYVPRHRRGAAEPGDNGSSAAAAAAPPPETSSKTSSREQSRVPKRPIERTPIVRKTPEATQVPVIDKVEPPVVQVAESSVEKMEQEVLVTPTHLINNTVEKTDSTVASVSESELDDIESELSVTGTSMCEKMEDQSMADVLMEKMIAEAEEAQALSEESLKIKKALMTPPNYQADTRSLRRNTKPDVQVDPCSEISSVTSNTMLTSNEKDRVLNENANHEPIKKPLISNVIVISANDKPQESVKKEKAPTPMTPPEKKVKKVERPKSKPAPPPAPSLKINRDECDWDSLFDDNGDCLDPTLIEELTSSVGEVVIEKPKSSYKSFSRPAKVSTEEFGHVLEIYNFPSDFKSSDLAAVFSPFKPEGFELKWVDDTHCLAVFSSPLVAAEVLASDHPFVKTRPLSEATALSKAKARKSSEFLQPFKTRPETCAALARRLVTKSLGVKLATARQEREQEKIVLREAKEKKRLVNKQREEIWEGIIAPKPTS